MFYIAICDDEPDFIDFLRDGVQQIMAGRGSERYQIDAFTGPAHLLQKVKEGVRYHILFQDILLGDENGIETARQLRDAHGANASIIFVSSQPQFAVDTFVVGPANFLTKPFTLEALGRALAVSLKKWEEETTIRVIDVGGATHYVCLTEICYIELYYRQVILHLRAGKEVECSAESGEELLAMLPSPRFCQCHRNYIANMSDVRMLEQNRLHMHDGTVLPISRRRFDETEKAFGKQMEVMP